jgi:hypothetical protein
MRQSLPLPLDAPWQSAPTLSAQHQKAQRLTGDLALQRDDPVAVTMKILLKLVSMSGMPDLTHSILYK